MVKRASIPTKKDYAPFVKYLSTIPSKSMLRQLSSIGRLHIMSELTDRIPLPKKTVRSRRLIKIRKTLKRLDTHPNVLKRGYPITRMTPNTYLTKYAMNIFPLK